MPPTRLQLGTSRLEKLSREARAIFVDKSWIHLGDPPQPVIERIGRIVFRGDPILTRRMYQGTDFREFFFHPGGSLPFESGQFGMVYSEHFFEHLTPELAHELFIECKRVLKAGGVLRTVVPDAILRTYEPPEPVGHPPHRPEGHPQKHLVRYTLDTLSSAIEDAGFRAIPLDYCTADGKHIQRSPSSLRDEYERSVGCADWSTVADTSYIMRVPSLIVDAIKES